MGNRKRASLCRAMLLWFKEGRGAVTPSGRWSEAERLQCSESGYEEQFYTVEIPRRYIAGWQEGLERKTKVSLALRLSQLCGGPRSLHHGRWRAFGTAGDSIEPPATMLSTRHLWPGLSKASWDSLETVFSCRQVSFGQGFIFLPGERERRGKGRSHKVFSDQSRRKLQADIQTCLD